MIRLFILLPILFGNTFAFAQNYLVELTKEREEHEKSFLSTVLNKEERAQLTSLCYFPIDTNYKVEATFLKKKDRAFAMPMTIERIVYYRKVGELQFYIHDTLCKLTVYQNIDAAANPAYKNQYFIPFKDETRGISTYGAGKYLDCTFQKKQKKVVLDFNRSYHPYCAYSERYSCPIVPEENTLPVSIEAGECYQAPK